MNSTKLRHNALIMCLVVVLYALGTVRFIFSADLNHDEGYYLYTAQEVYQGKVPYADFALFQGPLLPYVYGLPQAVIGSSILLGRVTSFVLGLATLMLSRRTCS